MEQAVQALLDGRALGRDQLERIHGLGAFGIAALRHDPDLPVLADRHAVRGRKRDRTALSLHGHAVAGGEQPAVGQLEVAAAGISLRAVRSLDRQQRVTVERDVEIAPGRLNRAGCHVRTRHVFRHGGAAIQPTAFQPFGFGAGELSAKARRVHVGEIVGDRRLARHRATHCRQRRVDQTIHGSVPYL